MDFDKYASSYAEKMRASIQYCPLTHDFFTRVKAEHLCGVVEATHGKKGQPVLLDLGCGGGLTDSILKNRFQNLHGLDVSQDLIAVAQDRNPEVNYRTYDGVRSEFEDGAFDVIFAICVWHHVPPPNWPAFAAECFRLLKPGGFMLVYEHNPYNPLTRLSVARCEFDSDAVLLPPRRVRQLLQSAGFQRCETNHLLFLPLDRSWCRRVENFLLRKIPLGAQYVVCATK